MKEASKTVLLTGANGFIGRKILDALATREDLNVIAVVRRETQLDAGKNVQMKVVEDYLNNIDWKSELSDVDFVIHVAGIIKPPTQSQDGTDPADAMMRVNRDITRHLATAAVASNVKRFIYLSSLSVFGEENNDRLLTPESPVEIDGLYPESKYAGEVAIEEVATDSPMVYVHVRPPMVVGLGTQGTFYSLANLCAKLGFSPFGGIKKPFPIVRLPTLVDFVLANIYVPDVESGVYLVGEKKKFTVSEIISEVAALSGKTVRHISVPKFLLQIAMISPRVRSLQSDVISGLFL